MLAWGNFVTIVINFLIIAWVLFMVVRGHQQAERKEAEKPAKPAEAPRQEVLLQEIRDILAKKPPDVTQTDRSSRTSLMRRAGSSAV